MELDRLTKEMVISWSIGFRVERCFSAARTSAGSAAAAHAAGFAVVVVVVVEAGS